jgi:hypothetical protein
MRIGVAGVRHVSNCILIGQGCRETANRPGMFLRRFSPAGRSPHCYGSHPNMPPAETVMGGLLWRYL